MLNEISQAQNDKYRMISLMWNTKKSNSLQQRVEWWLLGVGVGEMGRY